MSSEKKAREVRSDAYLACPRFDICACNNCPLDPDAALHGGRHQAVAGEDDCRATRSVRERVAAQHGLPPGYALLPRERLGDARRAAWASLPPGVRERRTAGLLRAPGPFLTGVLREGDVVNPEVADQALRSSKAVSGRLR